MTANNTVTPIVTPNMPAIARSVLGKPEKTFHQINHYLKALQNIINMQRTNHKLDLHLVFWSVAPKTEVGVNLVAVIYVDPDLY